MIALRVLVIDDEQALRTIVARLLSEAGHRVEQAGSALEGGRRLAAGDFDVALCDLKLGDGNGIELMRKALEEGCETAFVILTAYGSLEVAVEALRAGAADFIVKPVRRAELLHRLQQIASIRGLQAENKALRKSVASHGGFRFESESMRLVQRLLDKVAPSSGTVLITGESGTGKGVTARQIHEASGHARGPFVAVNCSAIPETLIESELFGHVRGAFTGADKTRRGLFVEADRGTLFLDEIGDLPMTMQTKLLHVIEEKSVRPIGSEQARKVDVRIVAATNRDLSAMVSQGRFREDLLFRLSVFRVELPPLRERGADMPRLIRYMLARVVRNEGGLAAVDIDPTAEEALLTYDWPGNVREFENAILRAHVMADGERITLADLPPEITRVSRHRLTHASASRGQGSLRERMRRHEAEIITAALADCGGDRRRAAAQLGIGLSSLYRKLEELAGGADSNTDDH
ncbi:MAG: sigma-54 dependent transcriptional regulator [Burkholderiaceae bacterium]